jgi:hypothetical protein
VTVSQFCPRCHASASHRYCPRCGLDLQSHKPTISAGDAHAAREREREWLATTTGAGASTGAAGGEGATSPDLLVRIAYWTQRARFLDHLFREAMTHAEALYAQCVSAGIDKEEIRRHAGSMPSWASQLPSRARPSTAASAPGAAAGGFAVAGFYAESGPDLDGDGDVDGGLFDKLDQLFE